MVNLILFIAATIGLTNLFIYGGSIFKIIRDFVEKNFSENIFELFKCYQCMGTWVGFLVGYILLTHDFFGVLMCGFAGSFLANSAAILTEYVEANSMVATVGEPGKEMISFVKNEVIIMPNQSNSSLSATLNNTPVIAGSFTGTIYVDEIFLTTLNADQDGKISLHKEGTGHIEYDIGHINLNLNKQFDGEIKLIISYEYINV